ncbi:hypothetical protein [uncultured Clostridium sp.]|uniref:hypothetical protein n=1 Tax=uncultured Clostridium sp. TaxID=59620 RepID=UPI0025FE5437|nr:hypothetical protein [uncultured Clostridium sp.]
MSDGIPNIDFLIGFIELIFILILNKLSKSIFKNSLIESNKSINNVPYIEVIIGILIKNTIVPIIRIAIIKV